MTEIRSGNRTASCPVCPAWARLRCQAVQWLALLLVLVSQQTHAVPPGDALAWRAEDPWESVNRRIFQFNETLDAHAIKPAATAYRRSTPAWLRQAVNRWFGNLRDARSSVHGILQWEWHQAGHNFGRFGVNTTLGVAGFFDVATSLGLKKYAEDFGLTLGQWGVSPGPFLMLPLMGPSTVRDSLVIYPDRFLLPDRYVITHDMTRYSMTGVNILAIRESLLDMERGLQGDRYLFIRSYYLGSRREEAERADDDFEFGDFPEGDDDW